MTNINNTILYNDIIQLAKLTVWEKLSGKTLLITGATGMLGAYLTLATNEANRLGGYKIRLVLLCRDFAKAKALFGGVECRFLFQDVRKPLGLDEPIHNILHTAGPVGPTIFEQDPTEVISTNVEGALRLLRYAVQYDCQGFVLASTHEVYGQADGEQREDAPSGIIEPMNPRTCYILAKQTAENLLACYSKQYGLRTMSARFSRLYGPLMNMKSGLFVCDFINDVLGNKPVLVRGGLNLLRPLCYISDAAKAALYILAYGASGEAYNVQGGELPNIGEIAETISGYKTYGIQIDRPETKGLPPSGHWLNTDKLKNLEWNQSIKLSEGLKRTFDYYNG